MTESFEHQHRSYRIWTWLYGQLQKNEFVNQSEIIEYAEKNSLGSKKSVLGIINEFVSSKLLQEVDLNSNSVGRPKKGYSKFKENNIDLILFNLAEIPPTVKEFISDQAVTEKITPTEVIIKLLSWSYNFLFSMQYEDTKPLEIPDHLKQHSDPLSRLVGK